MVYTQTGTNRKSTDPAAMGVPVRNHLPHNSVRTVGQLRFSMRPGDSRLQIRENFINLGPDSLPPGGFAQDDVFFDFRLTGSGVHTLTGMVLQLTVRNTNPALGRGVIPLIPHWFFNRIEVQSNGSFTDDTIYPPQMYIRHMHAHMPARLKTLQSESLGMEASSSFTRTDPRFLWNCWDEDGIEIPAGGSKDYFIPLHNLISQSTLFLPSKQQDPRFRFYLAKNPIRSDNDPLDVNGTPLLVQGALMILHGIIYANEILLSLADHYTSLATFMPTITHERQVIDIKSATEGVEIADQSLTSLNGEYIGFWVWLQRGNAVKEQQYAANTTYTAPTEGWLPIKSISLKDSSGNPIGFNNIPTGFLKGTAAANQFPDCDMSAMKNLYFIPFAKNCLAALQDGTASGGLAFDSNFTLSVTPGVIAANPATLNFQLWVFGARRAYLVMSEGGSFSVKKQ